MHKRAVILNKERKKEEGKNEKKTKKKKGFYETQNLQNAPQFDFDHTVLGMAFNFHTSLGTQ